MSRASQIALPFFALPLFALSGGACVTVPPPPPVVAQSTDAPTPTPPEPAAVEPSRRAAQLDIPAACVAEARASHACAADWSWDLLKACAVRGHFTALRELLDGTFDGELVSRPEAPSLLARMIAMRGGSIEDDLRLLHARRIPLFSLAEATARPDLYRGHLVVLRAETALATDKQRVRLIERQLASAVHEVDEGPVTVVASRSDVAPEAWGNAWGPPPGNYEQKRLRRVRRTYNYEVDTGLEAIAELRAPDPFFDLGDTFVVLARFEGMQVPEGAGGRSVPVLSVIDYARPAMMVSF